MFLHLKILSGNRSGLNTYSRFLLLVSLLEKGEMEQAMRGL